MIFVIRCGWISLMFKANKKGGALGLGLFLKLESGWN